jgi:hypothetical protein
VKGYRDRKATEALAVQLEKKAARLAEGISDPTDDHAKTPLAEHAKDHRRYLVAKGNTPAYVAMMLFRLTATLDGCRFIKITGLQSSAVVEFLGKLRNEGKSVKTVNDYLGTIKASPAGSGGTSEVPSTLWPACRNCLTRKRTFATPAVTFRPKSWPDFSTRPGKAHTRSGACPASTGTFST